MHSKLKRMSSMEKAEILYSLNDLFENAPHRGVRDCGGWIVDGMLRAYSVICIICHEVGNNRCIGVSLVPFLFTSPY